MARAFELPSSPRALAARLAIGGAAGSHPSDGFPVFVHDHESGQREGDAACVDVGLFLGGQWAVRSPVVVPGGVLKPAVEGLVRQQWRADTVGERRLALGGPELCVDVDRLVLVALLSYAMSVPFRPNRWRPAIPERSPARRAGSFALFSCRSKNEEAYMLIVEAPGGALPQPPD